MFKLKTMPKDAAAELLHYLAEYEEFRSIDSIASGDFTIVELRALLRELAGELTREAVAERQPYNVKSCSTLSKKAKEVISCLSSHEEESLLSAFGLIAKHPTDRK